MTSGARGRPWWIRLAIRTASVIAVSPLILIEPPDAWPPLIAVAVIGFALLYLYSSAIVQQRLSEIRRIIAEEAELDYGHGRNAVNKVAKFYFRGGTPPSRRQTARNAAILLPIVAAVATYLLWIRPWAAATIPIYLAVVAIPMVEAARTLRRSRA
ncbi:MAG TPA: hypothetical protein VGJ28_04870 [Micromonosporaceae bacterium]